MNNYFKQEVNEGDFGVLASRSVFYPAIIIGITESSYQYVWCTNHIVRLIDDGNSRISSYYCNKLSFIKLGIDEAIPEVKKNYSRILKHVKRI